MSRGVLANLDVEAVLGGRPLPERVGRRVSAVASLMAVFAEQGEPLWTPVPVDARRVLDQDGLARPEFVNGEATRPPEPRVAWCSVGDPALLSRRFGDDCARAFGCRLAGTLWVDTLEQLVEGLGEAPYAGGGEWVLKPALSAAGRGALRGRQAATGSRAQQGQGAALLDGTPVGESPALASLFSDGGALLMPWMHRLDDVGCRARITGGRLSIEGMHRVHVTPSGGFRGVEVHTGDASLPDLPDADAAQLVDVTTGVGARLLALGYEGPFGVDAFAYRGHAANGGHGGERRFLPLCEVNVRYTFGFVTAALAERLGARRGWPSGTRVGLHIGRGPLPPTVDVPLLAPGTDGDDDTSAWLEVRLP